VPLAAGQRSTVEISLEPRVLASYDLEQGAFVLQAGHYRVWAAEHALDEGLGVDLQVAEARRL
jgi:hypothetical protein